VTTVDGNSTQARPWNSRYEEVLRPHLPYATDVSLKPTDALADLGLDSLGVVQLLMDIEGAYGVAFPDEQLTADTFATVESLWQVVSGLADEQTGG
jgi:acyl carrier protein